MKRNLLLIVLIQIVFTSYAQQASDFDEDVSQIENVQYGYNPNNAKYAKIAREIVHKSNWTTLGTLASLKPIKGYPVVTKIPTSDSKLNETSSGNVYFYLRKTEQIYYDLRRKNELTALFTNDTDNIANNTDSSDQSRNHVLIIGYVAQLPLNTTEHINAVEALESRHPASKIVMNRRNTILCKLEIIRINVFEALSGSHTISIDEYYNTDVDE